MEDTLSSLPTIHHRMGLRVEVGPGAEVGVGVGVKVATGGRGEGRRGGISIVRTGHSSIRAGGWGKSGIGARVGEGAESGDGIEGRGADDSKVYLPSLHRRVDIGVGVGLALGS